MTEDSAATGAGEIEKELREAAADRHRIAWSRSDGGQEWTLEAMMAERAADELARLRAENASMADGMVALVTLHADALRAKDAEIERLIKALTPFAVWIDKLEKDFADHPDDTVAGGLHEAFVTFGDLRRARAALKEQDHDASPSGVEMVRHIKRGSTYRVLHRGAELQMATDVVDGTEMVVYQCLTDGRVWVRAEHEFDDGRFETLAAIKEQDQ